jgi:hypothetical protein
VRSFLVLGLVGALGFLGGCGSSGTPAGIAVTISLSPTSASVNAGGTVNIVATVANDSSGKGVSWSRSGVGTLSSVTTTGVTYNAPATVATTSVATVVATSVASPTVTASLQITVSPAGSLVNVVPISVNGGPVPIYPNGAFVSVQVCVPNTSTCQTIDDVLVDTGSFGLRLLGSQVNIPLVPLTDSSNNTLYDCVQFLDGSLLWGTVAPADIVMAGEVANATSIQVIANPAFIIPSGCSGTNEDTQASLLANGILGVGPEPFDCGAACDPLTGGNPPQGAYYLCSSGGNCNPTFVSCGASNACNPLETNPNQQVTNPVFNFATDNNGVILELPPVNDVAATVDGMMVFGIGTQSNNALPSTATVFTLNNSDNFTTNFNGQSLTGSFIDSGSNGLFFPDGSLSICSDSMTWYCQAASNLSATNVDPNNGTTTNTVVFNVDDFDTVTAANPTDAAFSNLAGPNPGGFDWGLPFFYGRNVYTAIRGQTVGTGLGPFWAY